MSPTVHRGDMREVLAGLDARFHAVVTDPPYELKFMGRKWDGTGIAFQPETWALVGSVMLPGAHLVAFGGTKGFHRMACAIEDAGFEIRDTLAWLYGSGFPKSHNVSKAIDRAAGHPRGTSLDNRNGPNTNNATKGDKYSGGFIGQSDIDAGAVSNAARAWDGWGTALKPSYEPIILARWPMAGKTVAANVLTHGTGALNIDGCRVATDGESFHAPQSDPAKRSGVVGADLGISGADAAQFQAAQRASIERTAHLGRWPANVVHDGSEEVERAFPDTSTGNVKPYTRSTDAGVYGLGMAAKGKPVTGSHSGDSGSAARFFYSAKADADDRLGSKHPTVKPVDLMRWLVRLVTPKGGLVLDPFAGSGTTGMACMAEGFDCHLIEREAEYVADIQRRLAHVGGQDTPLFAPKQEALL